MTSVHRSFDGKPYQLPYSYVAVDSSGVHVHEYTAHRIREFEGSRAFPSKKNALVSLFNLRFRSLKNILYFSLRTRWYTPVHTGRKIQLMAVPTTTKKSVHIIPPK